MARNAAIGLIVASLAVIGSIEATATDGSDPATQSVGVRYECAGSSGVLEVANGAGEGMEAVNILGTPVAVTMIDGSYVIEPIEGAPIAPDGSVLNVRIGDAVFEINATDPEWMWE